MTPPQQQMPVTPPMQLPPFPQQQLPTTPPMQQHPNQPQFPPPAFPMPPPQPPPRLAQQLAPRIFAEGFDPNVPPPQEHIDATFEQALHDPP